MTKKHQVEEEDMKNYVFKIERANLKYMQNVCNATYNRTKFFF